ncbi:MAG: SDR family oxidoreductase [Chlorobi bacterium]|nr:SDR family oxidoreductase [Chlorobiota bacterium]
MTTFNKSEPKHYLAGKVAIVTGASSGIGEALAMALAAEGVRVTLASRRISHLEDIYTRITDTGGEALICPTDVTSIDETRRMAELTLRTFGKIDILVNNAGVMLLSFIDKLKIDEWMRMVDVNIKGVMLCTAAVLPSMLENERGDIVNISSIAGSNVSPSSTVYSATKAAVDAFSEGLRQELSPATCIRIINVKPGAVTTELTGHITDPDVFKMWEKHPLTQFLSAEDVACSIVHALDQPPHVSTNVLTVRPTRQRL